VNRIEQHTADQVFVGGFDQRFGQPAGIRLSS
jgi:hypothetical protein